MIGFYQSIYFRTPEGRGAWRSVYHLHLLGERKSFKFKIWQKLHKENPVS